MARNHRYSGVDAPGRVGLPPVLQRPDLPVRARLTVGSALLLWVVRPSWLWRREIAAAVVLVAVGAVGWLAPGWLGVAWLAWLGGWPGAVAGPVGVVALVAVVPWSRARVARAWWLARLRRHWDRACRFAALTTANDRIPRIRRARRVLAGERLLVRVPRGATVDDLESERERVAAVLRVREVRVARDVDRADWAHVDIVRRNPFTDPDDPHSSRPIPWPWTGAPQVNLWEPFPVAVDDMGSPVTMTLPGKNLLIGGEPESGKSVALSTVLAAAALDPWVRIRGLDAKRLELALWRPVMETVVYNDMDAATAFVEDMIKIMDGRYELLENAGRRSWSRGDGPLYLVPIDELRFYTANQNRRAARHFTDHAIDLAARGRAAGIILAAATQKPSGDVVDTSLRDLLAYRWAMRCTTRDASDTILGAGWASNGYSAAEIDVRTRGVGLLLAEGSSVPRLCKSYYLSDSDIRSIAARGAALRRVTQGDAWV